MPYNNNNSMDAVVGKLGVEGSIEFFSYALPRLIQRKKELMKHLSGEDWEAASQSASQWIGSVRLYGSAKLELLLDQVILLDPEDINPLSLQKELTVEFDNSIRGIRKWLNAHKSLDKLL